MGKISKSSKYVIDITGRDPLSFGELEGGGFQRFGELGAFGSSRRSKIDRRNRDFYKLT